MLSQRDFFKQLLLRNELIFNPSMKPGFVNTFWYGKRGEGSHDVDIILGGGVLNENAKNLEKSDYVISERSQKKLLEYLAKHDSEMELTTLN